MMGIRTDALQNFRQQQKEMEAAKPDTAKIAAQVNAGKASEYKQKLEPRLVAWRDETAPLIPGYAIKDYSAVSDNSDFAAVCANVSNLMVTYQQKIVQDSLANKSKNRAK